MKRPKSLLGIDLGAYWGFAADANHEETITPLSV